MRKKPGKLKLCKETLKALAAVNLQQAAGGNEGATGECTVWCESRPVCPISMYPIACNPDSDPCP